MNDRMLNILNKVKSFVANKQKVLSSYEYKCAKCGLVLEFVRNQSYVKCPNDNNTMFRV